MGGGQTGLASGVPALFYNPAGMSRYIVYTLEGSYLHLPGGGSVLGQDSFHVAVVDSKTQVVAAGVGYSYLPDGAGHHLVRGALAYPLVPQKLLVGVGGSYLFGDGVADPFSLDAGLVALLPASLTAGVAVRNALEARGRGALREYAVGLGWEGPVTLAVDLGVTPDAAEELAVGGGLEYVAGEVVPLWLGFRHQAGQDHVTAGLALSSVAAGLAAAYRQNVSDSGDRSLILGLRFNL